MNQALRFWRTPLPSSGGCERHPCGCPSDAGSASKRVVGQKIGKWSSKITKIMEKLKEMLESQPIGKFGIICAWTKTWLLTLDTIGWIENRNISKSMVSNKVNILIHHHELPTHFFHHANHAFFWLKTCNTKTCRSQIPKGLSMPSSIWRALAWPSFGAHFVAMCVFSCRVERSEP